MARIQMLLFLLTALISHMVSAAAPTFCKCTCFTNSTIIPLGPNHDLPPEMPSKAPPAGDDSTTATTTGTTTTGATTTGTTSTSADPEKSTAARLHVRLAGSDSAAAILPRGAPSSCAQCNRAFCLRYNLPICKDAEEKDVTTMCFQRDSLKDQIIVWGFILGTLGLLGWAGVRHVLEMRDSGAQPGSAAAAGGGFLGSSSSGGRSGRVGGGARRSWFGWARFMRRGNTAGGDGLSPRDDAARGAYSPLNNVYDPDGRGQG